MVEAKEDLTGRKFGRWTVLERAEDVVDIRGAPRLCGYVNVIVISIQLDRLCNTV